MQRNNSLDFKASQADFFKNKYQRGEREKELLFDFYVHQYALSYTGLLKAFNRLGLDAKKRLLVLDIGCGDRPLCYIYAKSSHCHVIGVDLSRKGLKTAYNNAAKIRFSGSFEPVVADLDKLPLKDGCFDVIIHSMVLEHLINPKLGLMEASRVLKMNGKILLFTVNKRYGFRKIFKVISPNYLKAMRHSEDLFYDITNIQKLFKETGLHLENEKFLFIFITAIWDLLLLPKFLEISIKNTWLITFYCKILMPLLHKLAIFDTLMKSLGHSSCLVAIGQKM